MLRKCAPSHLNTREIASFHFEMLEIPHFNRRETEKHGLASPNQCDLNRLRFGEKVSMRFDQLVIPYLGNLGGEK